jgi:lysophospholipase L1-like esterase
MPVGNRIRIAVGLVLAAAALVAPTAHASPQADQVGQGSQTGQATQWYLALGDSVAAGQQAGGTAHPDAGYLQHVLPGLQEGDQKTRAVNLACPGETTVTFLQGGRCSYDEGSQLDQALVFLRAHGRHLRLVTLTVGANNVQSCADRTTGQIDLVCVQQGMVRLAQDLPVILGALRAAAPGVEIVVTNYYNPFLATWFTPSTGPALAQASSVLQTQVNTVIAGSAQGASAEVADVATAFQSLNWTPLPNGVPTNVAIICTHTYMCVPGARPDIHPNDAGYLLIGAAVNARVG